MIAGYYSTSDGDVCCHPDAAADDDAGDWGSGGSPAADADARFLDVAAAAAAAVDDDDGCWRTVAAVASAADDDEAAATE